MLGIYVCFDHGLQRRKFTRHGINPSGKFLNGVVCEVFNRSDGRVKSVDGVPVIGYATGVFPGERTFNEMTVIGKFQNIYYVIESTVKFLHVFSNSINPVVGRVNLFT